MPVLPTRAMTCPVATCWPVRTRLTLLWLYRVVRPPRIATTIGISARTLSTAVVMADSVSVLAADRS